MALAVPEHRDVRVARDRAQAKKRAKRCLRSPRPLRCSFSEVESAVPMTPAQLTRLLQEFLAEARSAVIFENGEEVFAFTEDVHSARYSISGDHGKCLLHLWSPERNFVRRIAEAEPKKDSLLLRVLRFGQTKPVKLEIFRERDRRSPSLRKTSRSAYGHLLERVLKRHFAELKASKLSVSSNL